MCSMCRVNQDDCGRWLLPPATTPLVRFQWEPQTGILPWYKKMGNSRPGKGIRGQQGEKKVGNSDTAPLSGGQRTAAREGTAKSDGEGLIGLAKQKNKNETETER